MLRQRLKAMPSGIEALFALMFSSIDKEHRQSLSKCFFLLKWSAETRWDIVADVSLPVITAFLCASPHRSLSDLIGDCHVVEHRIIAQAKGLLETYPPRTHICGTDDEELQRSQFEVGILSDAVSGDIGYRSIGLDLDPTNIYKTSCIGWVHRSAYDYILGDHGEYTRSWRNHVDEDKLLRRLLEAQSWLAHYFPGQHASQYCAPVSGIASVIKDRTGDIQIAGFQALDKLYDTIEAAYYRGGCKSCSDLHRSREIGSKLCQIFDETAPLLAFWTDLADRSQGEYLVTRFDRIRSSAYADILCTGLVSHCWTSGVLNPFDYAESNLPAMTLSIDHLFDQGPMGDAVVTAIFSARRDTFCLSWRGRGGPKERKMVSDVSYALRKPRTFQYRADHVTKRHPETVYFLDEQNFTLKLGELADLWQMYCGRKLDACGTTPPPPLMHVSEPVHDWAGYKDSDPAGTKLSVRALPRWRLLCFGHTEDLARRLSSKEHIPIVACFDVRASKSKQLMNRIWRTRRGSPVYNELCQIYAEGTSGDKALCLGTILEEVWADADGQFDDGRQQLYMLACLRKYSGSLWEVQKLETHNQNEEQA